MSAGMWLPILAGIVNAYMCAGAENRMKKEGDKTDLNKWAKNVTMLSVLAMLGLVMRSM